MLKENEFFDRLIYNVHIHFYLYAINISGSVEYGPIQLLYS